jgi:hypothetical protein
LVRAIPISFFCCRIPIVTEDGLSLRPFVLLTINQGTQRKANSNDRKCFSNQNRLAATAKSNNGIYMSTIGFRNSKSKLEVSIKI